MTKEEAKHKILYLIEEAIEKTPESFEPDLPALEGFPDVSSWHDYEREIWSLGEEIRQIFIVNKSLRKDAEITEMITNFCLGRNAKRGRESFLMLLGYKHNQTYARRLIGLIDDKHVCGHVIYVLNKMRVSGFDKEVHPFTKSKITWVRNQAKKYIERHGTQQCV